MITRRRMLSTTATAVAAAATGTAGAAGAAMQVSAARFEHGIASGDPLPDRVILWTRISVDRPVSQPVRWWIAEDEAMTHIVNGGEVLALPWRDHCVKVDVTGLQPGTTYFYRFESGGSQSVVGRTRTPPTDAVERLRFAVASCSNYPFGFFNAYACIAVRDDLDAVLHLGDYIYEYAPGNYGSGSDIGRVHAPPKEIVTLDDYRQRHAQYKRDPDLQAAHRAHPWITVWDDHESTNNSWRDGADNHNPDAGEGSWLDRRRSAERAYFEWMPIRETLGARGSWTYRSFRYGNLCDLIMLDTRLFGRSQQVANRKDTAAMADPRRTLLGEDQHAWLAEELRASKHADTRWRVLGQQCMFGQLLDEERHILNTDQWDGYPLSRQRVLDQLRGEDIDNTIILTGDIHSAWAQDITPDPFSGYDPLTGEGALAVELVTTSVTSPAPFGSGDEAAAAEKRMVDRTPHLHWADFRHHGYLIVDLSADRALAEWWAVDTVNSRSSAEKRVHAMLTRSGGNHLENV